MPQAACQSNGDHLPQAECAELLRGRTGPVAVRSGAGGTRVQNAAHFELGQMRHLLHRLGFGEAADADQPLGLQGGEHGAQMGVTGSFDACRFGHGELVGCEVRAGI